MGDAESKAANEEGRKERKARQQFFKEQAKKDEEEKVRISGNSWNFGGTFWEHPEVELHHPGHETGEIREHSEPLGKLWEPFKEGVLFRTRADSFQQGRSWGIFFSMVGILV
jgi:hypothetical protein